MNGDSGFRRDELEYYRLMLTEMRAQILNKLRYREESFGACNSMKNIFLDERPLTRRGPEKPPEKHSLFRDAVDNLVQRASLSELRLALNLQCYEACPDIVAIAREFRTREEEIEKVLKTALLLWERVHPESGGKGERHGS